MTKFLSVLVTIAMIMILAITFLQVVMRFIFHVPIGGWDEVPTYMMLLGVWLTAAVNVKKKEHITLDIYVLFIKSPKARKIVQIITCFLTIVAFSVFIVLLCEFTGYNFAKKATTAGLSVPYWVILGIIIFAIALTIFYYLLQLINEVKEVIKWK
jgi:TRAP-type C4-dicarboxylate transport system permease small subunit